MCGGRGGGDTDTDTDTESLNIGRWVRGEVGGGGGYGSVDDARDE